MSASNKKIVDALNTWYTSISFYSTTPTTTSQAAGATSSINATASFTGSRVANTSVLPAAANNTGRMMYLTSTGKYVYSDGEEWKSFEGLNSKVFYEVSNASFLDSWGNNTDGQLGDGTTVAKCSPKNIAQVFTDWAQINVAKSSAAGIRANGTLWTWGWNQFGQLGDGTVICRSSPVSVVGGFTDWRQVSGTECFRVGLRNNGTLWSWGSDSNGNLGINSVAGTRSSPVSVVGGFTDWCQVTAGAYMTAAIRTNGTLWSWGDNSRGQLGDNTTVDKSSPVSVVGGFTDWCQVSGGLLHFAAIRTNGTLWAWGCNQFGQLGDGTSNVANKSSPVSVLGGFTDWCQVDAGQCHTAAIRTNGTLWTWGYNADGELGINSILNRSSPVSVIGGYTDWCRVSVGGTFGGNSMAAIRLNGTLWTWGFNGSGQLGDGTTVYRSSPVSVLGNISSWCSVSMKNSTTAIRKTQCGF